MSWIKDNKFIVALCGGTLVGAVLLYFIGSQGATRYEEAKAKFETAAAEATSHERTVPYPKTNNRDGKNKSIEDYRKSVESIQEAFAKYRPAEIKNLSPQEFSTLLLAANSETRKAFEDAQVTVPEPYFVGFEAYKTSLAPDRITGVLSYQLNAVKNIMLELAKAGPTELKNLHRPKLAEENGQSYEAGPNDVARPFPLEITFTGPEKSAREFLSAISNPANQYAIIRTLRISNEKKDPPRSDDAKFEKPAGSVGPEGGNSFAGAFVIPGDESVPAVPATEGATSPVSESQPGDSSRILAPVLGDEKVHVFVRLDVLQFLPAKKLP